MFSTATERILRAEVDDIGSRCSKEGMDQKITEQVQFMHLLNRRAQAEGKTVPEVFAGVREAMSRGLQSRNPAIVPATMGFESMGAALAFVLEPAAYARAEQLYVSHVQPYFTKHSQVKES